jgi:hypothetical protein
MEARRHGRFATEGSEARSADEDKRVKAENHGESEAEDWVSAINTTSSISASGEEVTCRRSSSRTERVGQQGSCLTTLLHVRAIDTARITAYDRV